MMAASKAVESASSGGSLSSPSPNSSEENVKGRRIGGVGRGVLLKEASERSSAPTAAKRPMGRGQMLRAAAGMDPPEPPTLLRSPPPPTQKPVEKKYFKVRGFDDMVDCSKLLEESMLLNDSTSESIRSSTSVESLNNLNTNLMNTSGLDGSLSSDQEHSDPLGSNTIDNIDKNETVSHLMSNDSESLSKYLERVISFGGLLHGDSSILPAKSVREMKLHPYVLDSLEKKGVQDLTRCQSYSIPSILLRKNYVLVGPPKSGKSVSYVIPLISLLLDMDFYKQVPDGNGPYCVVITSCAESVKNLARLFPLVYPRLSVIATYGGGLELERKDELTNGCDVLISTPRCWLRLLKYKFVTNERRLCHLVIDDMDLIASLYKPELFEILGLVDRLSLSRGADGPKPQVILVGETWTPTLEEITTKRLQSPVLCMTSHLEAALYARVKPKIHFLKPLSKQEKLIELLIGKEKMRCAVICTTTEEVIRLRHTLAPVRDEVLSAHGDMHHSMLRDVYNRWSTPKNDCQPPLLLACDDILNDLSINNAQWLLHYSLPKNKTNFSNRFSVIKSFFNDRIANPKLGTPNCLVDIFVDEENADQYPEVVNFMARLGTDIPQNLLDAVKKIKLFKESKKAHLPFCEELLQFGKCLKEPRCRNHHLINPVRDRPRSLPECGYIRIQILQVYTAVHFAVRLLSHTEKTNTPIRDWTPWPNSYGALSISLNSYYASRENRKRHGEPQVGDVVAIEVEPDVVFMRARVTDIESRDEKRCPQSVKIHFIDQGMIDTKNVAELIYLPPELKEPPKECFDLYLCGLLPVDLDRTWSYATTSFIKKKIKSQPQEYDFVAKVALCLGQNLLVQNLTCIEYIAIDNYSMCHFSVRQSLLEHRLAVKNPNHLPTLYDLCQDAGLKPPNPILDSVKKRKPKKNLKISNGPGGEIIKWAHLPRDEIVKVNFMFAKDPLCFCVKRCEFHPILEKLENDINAYMETQRERLTFDDVKPNAVCLALCRDKPVWNRAIMIQEWGMSEESPDYEVPVRFVDYGDVERLPLSSLADCPEQFIVRLPFQAIECELVGITPLDGAQWSEESIDALYDMCAMPGVDQPTWKNLDVKVCDLLLEAEMTGGRHYKVVLVDTTGEKDVVLNKEFMFRGYANWNNKEKHLLDDIKIGDPIKVADDDEERSNFDDDDDYTEVTTDTLFDAMDKAPQSTDCATKSDNEASSPNEDWSQITPYRRPNSQTNNAAENLIKYLSDNEANFDVVDPLMFPGFHDMITTLRRNNLIVSTDDNQKRPKSIKTTKKGSIKKKGMTSSGDGSFSDISTTRTVRASDENESGIDGDVSELDETLNTSTTSSSMMWNNNNCSRIGFDKGISTPNATWKQTLNHVYLNILLPDLKKYYLQWSNAYIYFSTVYDQKCYRLEIDFFGPIVPDSLVHTVKGLYLEIKMEKLVKGLEWIYLTYELERTPWLRLETVISPKEESLASCLCTIGEWKLKLGGGDKIIEKGKQLWTDRYLDDDLDMDCSDHSDPEEFPEIPYDPHDPIP